MSENRKRLHLKSRGRSKKELYEVPRRNISSDKATFRRSDPALHAEQMLLLVKSAVEKAEARKVDKNIALESDKSGVLISFEILNKSIESITSLENKNFNAELATVIDLDDTKVQATVYIPDENLKGYVDNLNEKISKYASSEGIEHKKLIEGIESSESKDVLAIFTGRTDDLPKINQEVWWELWSNNEDIPNLRNVARKMELQLSEDVLSFPDRSITLIYCNTEQLNSLSLNSSSILEIRLSRDNPQGFLEMDNQEIVEWMKDLENRYLPIENPNISVLILDGGTNRNHILLERFINPKVWLSHEKNWESYENSINPNILGHGTKMAGMVLYGDLTASLISNKAKEIKYSIETYKILPPTGPNPKKLFGEITKRAITRLEMEDSTKKRIICMALTSPTDTYFGQPSSWSAAVDQIAFGIDDEDLRRLFIISAGNIRDSINPNLHADYTELNRDIDSQIENPAQAWNALTVGAYTEKQDLMAAFRGSENYAAVGDLSPRSRTSFAWSDQWPVKPDIVMEGGNYLKTGPYLNREPEVSLLTTHHTPGLTGLDIFTDTSAATALAANMAADLYATYPTYWPETIRGLMVHSANWTKAMRSRLGTKRKQDKVDVLRQYGYGVPDIEQAKFSLSNNVTLVTEQRLRPFKNAGSSMQYGEMEFHKLPWIEANIDGFDSAKLTMRVTLSYFIEPNPSARGYIARYRYASHGLRFDLKRRNESENEFRQRMNSLARNEDYESSESKASRWVLGSQIRQMPGSIFSDWWSGPAIELAQCDSIAVFPVGGWWKSRVREPYSSREARYSLIVSIQTDNRQLDIDLLTPIENIIEIPIGVEV